MSILIKGMKMPKNCYVCPFCDYVSARCHALKGTPYTPQNRYELRAEWCPLVPVPPHGRLIDADKLGRSLFYGPQHEITPKHMAAFIKNETFVPTIIEAEEE